MKIKYWQFLYIEIWQIDKKIDKYFGNSFSPKLSQKKIEKQYARTYKHEVFLGGCHRHVFGLLLMKLTCKVYGSNVCEATSFCKLNDSWIERNTICYLICPWSKYFI